MRVLTLRHEPFEHLGHFASVLDSNNIYYIYHDLGKPLDTLDYDAVIAMGGPMSVNDDLSGLREELKLIENAIARDIPVLGICLGSQLIAKSLGAKVYRNAELEIGWEPVFLTPAAAADAVFQGIESPAMFFHWHGETFDLPSGAECLGYTAKCKHQAFRYGKKTYGIQFHPEITAEMIADWSNQPVNCGDVAAIGRPIDPDLHDTRESAQKILEAWLKLF